MTKKQLKIYLEIRKLLKEAYDYYFEHSDGLSKWSEGAVEINYPNYFDEKKGLDPLESTGIMIYSYVLGPSREHYFNSFEKALVEVKKWHKSMIETSPKELESSW